MNASGFAFPVTKCLVMCKLHNLKNLHKNAHAEFYQSPVQ